jgi:hypothetical protein
MVRGARRFRGFALSGGFGEAIGAVARHGPLGRAPFLSLVFRGGHDTSFPIGSMVTLKRIATSCFSHARLARVSHFFEQAEQVRRNTKNNNNIQLAHNSNLLISNLLTCSTFGLEKIEQVGSCELPP